MSFKEFVGTVLTLLAVVVFSSIPLLVLMNIYSMPDNDAYKVGYNDYPNATVYNQLQGCSGGLLNPTDAYVYCKGFEAASSDSAQDVIKQRMLNISTDSD